MGVCGVEGLSLRIIDEVSRFTSHIFLELQISAILLQ